MSLKKMSLIILIVLIILLLPILYFFTIYKTEYKSYINQTLKTINVNNSNLNVILVLSVIKTESNFNKNAKSNSDAYGLMQLQLATAKEVAEKMDMEITLNDLFNAEINIKLGINYLNYLFTIFDDKQLVLMSYNAGLNNVKSWIENNELKLKNGIYETPFKETTNYLKRVLHTEKVYKLMGIK